MQNTKEKLPEEASASSSNGGYPLSAGRARLRNLDEVDLDKQLAWLRVHRGWRDVLDDLEKGARKLLSRVKSWLGIAGR